MPTTRRSGIAIHFETTGSGRPLVLLHGGMGNLETWRMEGYVDDLRQDHRLILVDARGHGLSERPHDPEAYRAIHHAADVMAVLDELGIERANVAGWSFGAAVALRIAATHPHRLESVAALGPDVAIRLVGFADVPPPPPNDGERLARQFEVEGMAPVVRALEREGRPRWARLVARSDPLAMAACCRGLDRIDPVAARLADIETPLLLAWGELERPAWPVPLPFGARLVVIPEEDHVGAFGRSDILAPEIRRLVETAPAATIATVEIAANLHLY